MRRLALIAAVAAVLPACTAKEKPPTVIDSTVTSTLTRTAGGTNSGSYTPPAPSFVPGLAPGAPLPANAVAKDCPYISLQDASDAEGNRISHGIVFNTKPAGCRFYFWADPFNPTVDISAVTFPTPLDARNAMIKTGGAQAQGVPGLVPGVDAVLYQTKFVASDGGRNWACTFAKGKTMVTVKTSQTVQSFSARSIAEAIAPKF